MKRQIMKMLRTDRGHAEQLLFMLESVALSPDALIGTSALERDGVRLEYVCGGKTYFADLNRQKNLQCVRDANGGVVFAVYP